MSYLVFWSIGQVPYWAGMPRKSHWWLPSYWIALLWEFFMVCLQDSIWSTGWDWMQTSVSACEGRGFFFAFSFPWQPEMSPEILALRVPCFGDHFSLPQNWRWEKSCFVGRDPYIHGKATLDARWSPVEICQAPVTLPPLCLLHWFLTIDMECSSLGALISLVFVQGCVCVGGTDTNSPSALLPFSQRL